MMILYDSVFQESVNLVCECKYTDLQAVKYSLLDYLLLMQWCFLDERNLGNHQIHHYFLLMVYGVPNKLSYVYMLLQLASHKE